MTFLAIDFETANRYPNSACAIGLVRVRHNQIINKKAFLIKPPYNLFEYSHVHGITFDDVKQQPTFRQLWPRIKKYFDEIDFAVAHNASFDVAVLKSCCQTYGLEMPDVEFRCTMKLSRTVLQIKPANLFHVCRELFIPLTHHDAGSDAEACAKIMIEVLKRGG